MSYPPDILRRLTPELICVNVVDSLGGELYWAAGLSLISDFPKKAHWPVKTHLFLNAGRLDNIDKGELIPATLASPFSFVTPIASCDS